MGIWSTLYFQFDLRASFQKIFFLHIVQRDNALVGVDILQLYGVGNQCWHPSKGWCRYQPKAYTWTPSLCPNPFISKSSHSWIIYFCMWWCCMGKISINDYASLFWPKSIQKLQQIVLTSKSFTLILAYLYPLTLKIEQMPIWTFWSWAAPLF